MIQGEFEGFRCSVSIGPMAYRLCLVVETLHCRVCDAHTEVVEDFFLVLSDHPREFSHRFQPGMGSPPEPLTEVLFGPCGIGVIPEPSKGFLEKVGPVGFQIDHFQVTETNPLVLGEIPGILQPDVLGILEKLYALVFELSGFFLANLVHSVHEMADNMELVKDKQGLGKTSLDHLYVRSPHVAAYGINRISDLVTQFLEELLQGLRLSIFSRPQESRTR